MKIKHRYKTKEKENKWKYPSCDNQMLFFFTVQRYWCCVIFKIGKKFLPLIFSFEM